MSEAWTMPEWMKPYRGLLMEPNRAEEWMTRTDVSLFANAPAAVHQAVARAEVRLLGRLRGAGALPSVDMAALEGAVEDLTGLATGHRPTFAVPWAEVANADPVADVLAAQELTREALRRRDDGRAR